jgi:hypothetical protein
MARYNPGACRFSEAFTSIHEMYQVHHAILFDAFGGQPENIPFHQPTTDYITGTHICPR